MEAIRLRVKAEKDGELVLHGLPIHKSDRLEVIVLKEEEVIRGKISVAKDPVLKLCGLGKEVWKGVDPDGYVRNLREEWE